MHTSTTQQLQSIHSMLSAGHRNLRIERHSLLLWGAAAGSLFAISESILTPLQFPDLTQRATAWLVLLVLVLGLVGRLDWWWTGQVKQARDEAWSFIHRQVQKVWWLLFGLSTLCTFGMFFFGGGYMVCALWLVTVGLGLYLHGLFSEELLEWIGAAMMLVGIGSLFAGLPYESMRWVAAATFGAGMPLVAAMLDRGRHRAPFVRVAQLLAWLGLTVALPLVAVHRLASSPLPEAPVMPLDAFRASGPPPDGTVIIGLPAGTHIPVEIDVLGDVFLGDKPSVMTLTLARPLELLMMNGTLTDFSRSPGQAWQRPSQTRWIQIPWIRADLTQRTGPVVHSQFIVTIHQP